MPASDSAGVPFEGRHFDHAPPSTDDGSAPAALMEALRRFRSGEGDETGVVDAFRRSRLLIPLVARVGDTEVGDHGHPVDKSAELSIVTVAGPDGRDVMPVFSSVDTMRRWNPDARPVAADAVRVALSAAADDTELVVLDATSESEFVIRRPALWAIARSEPWTPSYRDPILLSAFLECAASEAAVSSVLLSAGDPASRLAGPELVVQLGIVEGLSKGQLDSVLGRLKAGWAASETIALRVDSLRVRLVSVAE